MCVHFAGHGDEKVRSMSYTKHHWNRNKLLDQKIWITEHPQIKI